MGLVLVCHYGANSGFAYCFGGASSQRFNLFGLSGYRFDDRSHDDYRHSVRCRVFSRESRANLDSARPDRIVSGLLTTAFTACFFLSKARIPLRRRKRDGALAYNFRMRF